VDPVRSLHAHGINYVAQVVFRIGPDERGVAHFIRPAGLRGGFLSGRKIRRDLGSINGGLTSGQPDEAFIEVVKPRAEY
jgi:hypothetical protein